MYDLAIIGGGINGCGIARDASGRGYSVFLAEKGDLAEGTSSGSTKLIHGGLRYLELYEFRLVRKSLREREVLWAMAPHIVWPLRFVLPCHTGMRPAWLLRFGLFLYDHIGGRKRLPGTRVLDLRQDPAGVPLKPGFVRAFEYSDCWVDDARLVVLNARDAADRGAVIRTRTAVTRAVREGGEWRVTVASESDGREREIRARMLINAAGPWVDLVLAGVFGRHGVRNVRLVQGSHVVVPRLFDHDRCYIFQNTDDRIFFAIPYEDDFTLIGTTDLDYDADPDKVQISNEEIDYICGSATNYFAKPVTPDRIVWGFSAVRPLYDDGAGKAQEATRDYVLKLEGEAGKAPLLNVFGGKITIYRRLAEAVLAKIETVLGSGAPAWTGTKTLPGGDFAVDGFDAEVARLAAEFPFLDQRTVRRLVRAYGTLARTIVAGASNWAELGKHFGAGLTQREVEYLQRMEWADTADDVLWRRSKLGLRLTVDERRALEVWLASHPPDRARNAAGPVPADR
jgi:glycerol-3-phosphate dehydrogenase